MKRLIKIIWLCGIVGLMACGGDGQPQEAKIVSSTQMSAQDLLLQENQYIVEDEQLQMDELIARYGWEMNGSGTGLRYMIYKSGEGEKAETGRRVKVRVEIRLITGELVKIDDDVLVFTLHHSSNINGLEEGVLMMREGDRAKLVVPSYLAYGLSGYDDKIPMRSTLLFDVELLKVESN